MFKETKCPECNTLMIGTIATGDNVMYLCPNHSFRETVGKTNLSDKVIQTGEAIRKAIFISLKDYHV